MGKYYSYIRQSYEVRYYVDVVQINGCPFQVQDLCRVTTKISVVVKKRDSAHERALNAGQPTCKTLTSGVQFSAFTLQVWSM